MQGALFLAGLFWLVAAKFASEHAAAGLAITLHLIVFQPLLREFFFLFLLIGGFAVLHWIATRDGSVRLSNALPERETAKREWMAGAALGWCMLLVTVLPMVLLGDLHPQFWLAPRAWGITLLSLLALAASSLAIEVAFRGYIFRRLILAIGSVAATVAMALIYALFLSVRADASSLSFVFLFLEGVLFALAYHRTHALWLGWGMRFAWTASMTVLFGLPIRGSLDYASLVATTASGSRWVTGGMFGPDASLLGSVVVMAAMVPLYAITKDFAWHYTFAPIVPAGYAVTVQPPAAHTAMEQNAAAPAPASLVQIASITPAAPSTLREIEEHLRSRAED